MFPFKVKSKHQHLDSNWYVRVYPHLMVLYYGGAFFGFDRKPSTVASRLGTLKVTGLSAMTVNSLGPNYYVLEPTPVVNDALKGAGIITVANSPILACLASDNFFVYNSGEYFYKGNKVGKSYKEAYNNTVTKEVGSWFTMDSIGQTKVFQKILAVFDERYTKKVYANLISTLEPVADWDVKYYPSSVVIEDVIPMPGEVIDTYQQILSGNQAPKMIFKAQVDPWGHEPKLSSAYRFVINNGKVVK